jgi:hypothetical protein
MPPEAAKCRSMKKESEAGTSLVESLGVPLVLPRRMRRA